MKKFKSFIAFVLMFAMLFSLNVMFDGLADPDGGLNGSGGNVESFDESRYDAIVDMCDMADAEARGQTVTFRANVDFKWPDGQVILIKVTGSAWDKSVLDCISVPNGKVVDVYELDMFGGTYTFWAHYGANVSTANAAAKPSNRTADGLNGSTCSGADFDRSVYTDVTGELDIRTNRYQWPSSGKVLIEASGRNWTVSDFTGTVIPAGLTVDIYKYYKAAGDADKTYKLVAHFDTTDGKAYTVGTAITNVSDNNSSETAKPNTTVPETPAVTKPNKPGKPAAYTHSYSDVKPGDWYYDAVMTMTEGGLLAGYPDGRFGPNDLITFGQFKLILARARDFNNLDSIAKTMNLGSNRSPMNRAYTAMSLVNNLYSTNKSGVRVYRALTDEEYKLAKETHVFYNDNVVITPTRILEHAMVDRAYEFWKSTLNTGIDYHTSVHDFPDGDAIWQYCCDNPVQLNGCTIDEQREYVANHILYAWNLGIFRGDANGNFNAADTLTRAQLCQVLYNMGWTEAGCAK